MQFMERKRCRDRKVDLAPRGEFSSRDAIAEFVVLCCSMVSPHLKREDSFRSDGSRFSERAHPLQQFIEGRADVRGVARLRVALDR